MRWLHTLPVLLALNAPAPAGDWPQWLGPRRDGSSSEKVKPWKGDLKVLWRKGVGPGHSSPVVAGGKVYLHTRVPDKDKEQLTAYDARTGKPLWAKAYPRDKFDGFYGTGPQATPAVAGGRVYAFGITGVLTCFDADKGSVVWQVDTKKKFRSPSLKFGCACSPLVEDGKVVLNVGAKGASIVAFTADKGEVAWKALDDPPSYSSGIAFGEGKQRQLVFLTDSAVRSLSPAGKPLWMVPFHDKLNESSSTPARAGDVLMVSSIFSGMLALKLGPPDGKPSARQAWKNPALTCYFSTPIPVGKGHVYLVTGRIFPATSTLRCVDLKTGKELWNKPKVGKYHAALLRTADDKLLMLSDLGHLVLLDPDPKGYKELARSKVGKGEQIWAHPALSEGRLYLRDEKELICLQLPE
jgi:outer membrane protein assembly factor BamB